MKCWPVGLLGSKTDFTSSFYHYVVLINYFITNPGILDNRELIQSAAAAVVASCIQKMALHSLKSLVLKVCVRANCKRQELELIPRPSFCSIYGNFR